MRIALGLGYDGREFHGWQRQPGLRTVQGELEKALSRIGNHAIEVSCAGRTDAGVHALGQVVHFDTASLRSLQVWQRGVNSYLPADVVINWAAEVPEDFHARFSALSRSYRYVIYQHPVRPVMERHQALWLARPLCATLMQQAAQCLLGEHDFSSFRASECQAKTPMRNVQAIQVQQQGAWLKIDITANAFLHHMVRNIVGSLLIIGMQKRPLEWLSQVLEAKDRKLAAATAPAHGLSFTRVLYPQRFGELLSA